MTKVDLHMHTTASDGTYDPETLIEKLKEKNIEIFAIADHDEVSNVLLTEYLAKKASLKFVRASELCSRYKGKEYHILAYDIDINNLYLNKLMLDSKLSRVNRDFELVKYFEENYDNTSLKEYKEYMKKPYIGGFPCINYAKEKGIAMNLDEFHVVRNKAKFSKKSELQKVQKVIKIVKEAGGIPILAHPSYHHKDDVMSIETLDEFREMGIEGLECYCAYNKEKWQCDYYVDYCKKHNMAVSGGSDCHGDFDARKLGEPDITLDMINVLDRTKNYKAYQKDAKIF